MSEPITDVWTVMSTTRTSGVSPTSRLGTPFLAKCLEAATWAPSGANAQGWRFVVLRSPEQRAVVGQAAAQALAVIEPVYGLTRPADDDHSRRARTNRATYEIHDRAGEFTSVLFAQKRYPSASELLLGGSIFPAMQNFLLAARALGLGPASRSWASYGGEALLQGAVGVPPDWMLAGHIVVGWPLGPPRTGPPPPAGRSRRRRPLGRAGHRDHGERSEAIGVQLTFPAQAGPVSVRMF